MTYAPGEDPTRRGLCYRAYSALRSRTGAASQKTVDDVWEIGVVRILDANAMCAVEVNDHVWSEPYVFPADEIVLQGCTRCSAVKRVALAPEDLTDRDALQRWLNA